MISGEMKRVMMTFTLRTNWHILAAVLFLCSFTVNGQSPNKFIREGNKQYEQKKYQDAEINYRKSLNKNENPSIPNYNLGNTYYQMGKFDEAKSQYESAASGKTLSPEQLSKVYHNLGNAELKAEKYRESIEAYKQALKLNPKDNDTRYNLAYAQSKLMQQQQQQNDKDNKDNKDKDKDQEKKENQKNEKQDKQENQKKEQQQQEQNKEQNKEEQKQARKDKISREDAEKILQALNNDEKKTQKKMNVKDPVKIQIEKDW